ncbi:MAG TPA: NAD(P)/FAD-dependent oxidoreductase [Nitrososphaeraceae archaeon]|nr:NAD(P)/FAD-dependent oxidoreductase [Nitrososphaeraceae archaeon]
MSNEFDNSDVIIIGGGLAGLTTAALLARSGKVVTLFERSSKEIGGRARSTEVDGFYLNQGPHALFLTDAADSILKEIGISFTGGTAGGKGKSYLISDGRKREVPGDYGSWLSSGKGNDTSVETDGSQFFNSPTEMDFSQLDGVTVQEWLDKNFHNTNDAEIIKAILRLNTYGNDPEIQSIGSALRQIYVSSQAGGVMYVDGGWQTLVDGLLTVAKNSNARIVMDKKAISVKRTDSSAWQVLLSDKTQVSAKIVVIAAGPMDAYGLFDSKERPEMLSKAAKEAKPVRLVCLDVALSSLPDKDALFALGVDRPLYFSVHSAYAKLAPEGGALIHVAKYLGSSIAPKPREDQPELEELLDLMQPGWREVLVKKRPLPSMVVSNAVIGAATGGLAGRPDVRIADNLYIVGDWVGKEGILSNASVASAKHAAQLILNE